MFSAGSKDPQNSFLTLPLKLPTQPLEVISAFCPFHGCKVTAAVLMFISLITNELEHLFICLLMFWISFCKLPSHISHSFSPGFTAFCMLIWIFIYISFLHVNPLLILYLSLLVLDIADYLWLSFSSWNMPCSSGFGAFVLAVLSASYVFLPDTCKQGSLDI